MPEVFPAGVDWAWAPPAAKPAPTYPQPSPELTDTFLSQLEGALGTLEPTTLRFDLVLKIVHELRTARERIRTVEMVARHAAEMTGATLDPAWVLQTLRAGVTLGADLDD